MATHSSVLAWRIPGTGEPGGLPSMGSHGVGHDWSDLAATHFLLNASLISPIWIEHSSPMLRKETKQRNSQRRAFLYLVFCVFYHIWNIKHSWNLSFRGSLEDQGPILHNLHRLHTFFKLSFVFKFLEMTHQFGWLNILDFQRSSLESRITFFICIKISTKLWSKLSYFS